MILIYIYSPVIHIVSTLHIANGAIINALPWRTGPRNDANESCYAGFRLCQKDYKAQEKISNGKIIIINNNK